jgi:hypothetical protein
MKWVIGSIMLAACAHRSPSALAEQELGPIPSGFARVCVIRPSLVGSAITMELRDNGRLVGATRGGTYACWLAPPGEHQITSIDDDTGPTLLSARADGDYWLHQDVTKLAHLHAHLDWVDARTAENLIERCSGRVRVNVSGYDEAAGTVAIAPAKRR